VDWTAPGPSIGPDIPCLHAIEVLAMVIEDRLHVSIASDPSALAPGTPPRFADALQAAFEALLAGN
jgi:hypothetical protein